MTAQQQPGPLNQLVWDRAEPAGRSGRPALSRERITRAAIGIADAEGPQAVTMRRLAGVLGAATPMSLYRYIGDKDGLVDLMLDQVYGEIVLPDEPPGGWRENLSLLAHRTRAALRHHPWFPALSHHRPGFGPHALRHTEWQLRALDGCGLSTGMMMSVARLVFGYAMSFAHSEAEETRMRQRIGVSSDRELRAVAAPYIDRIVRDGRYPRLSRWITEGHQIGTDEQFELGLECLLDGLAARVLRPHGPDR